MKATVSSWKLCKCQSLLFFLFFFLLTEQQNTDYIHTYNTSEEEYSVHIWVNTHIILSYKCIHQKLKSAFNGAKKSHYNLDNNILNTHSCNRQGLGGALKPTLLLLSCHWPPGKHRKLKQKHRALFHTCVSFNKLLTTGNHNPYLSLLYELHTVKHALWNHKLIRNQLEVFMLVKNT